MAPTESPDTWRTRLRQKVRAVRSRVRHRRERIRGKPGLNMTYRVALGTFGGIVLLAGVLMIPYPGPGWLVVFAGLGILATEFAWAHRVNLTAKHYYQRWVGWLRRQHWTTKLLVMGGTGLVVAATLWLLGVFHMTAGWFGLHWPWLASPLLGP